MWRKLVATCQKHSTRTKHLMWLRYGEEEIGSELRSQEERRLKPNRLSFIIIIIIIIRNDSHTVFCFLLIFILILYSAPPIHNGQVNLVNWINSSIHIKCDRFDKMLWVIFHWNPIKRIHEEPQDQFHCGLKRRMEKGDRGWGIKQKITHNNGFSLLLSLE